MRTSMAARPSPEISVIIPVRNGAGSIPTLLRSLATQTLPRERFEVLVVDNASTDATAEVASQHGARVVTEPVANRSRARNAGAAVARGRRYAFTDADCIAGEQWLEQLLMCADRAPLVAGPVKIITSKSPNVIERFEMLWRFGQEWWVKEGWAATANLFVEADAFEAVGGFDPAWRHIAEDADFCIRAGRAGYPLAYCPNAMVEHQGERSIRPVLRRFFLHGYSTNQAFYRLGMGYRAWRAPGPALKRDSALRQIGQSPESFDPAEWRRMARIARLGYVVRMVGSLWAEVVRAR